jgi:hypothetical protein
MEEGEVRFRPIKRLCLLLLGLTCLAGCHGTPYVERRLEDLRPIAELGLPPGFRVERQQLAKDCCIANIVTLTQILTGGLGLDYSEVQAGLRGADYPENLAGYVGTDAFIRYFNEGIPSAARGGCMLQRQHGESLDAIIAELEQSRPVVVSYMLTPFRGTNRFAGRLMLGVAAIVDVPLLLASDGAWSLRRGFLGGEDDVYQHYLHSAVVLGVYEDPRLGGERLVHLADPWDGYLLIGAKSSPEPALMQEQEFMLRWTQWEKLGIQSHWLAKWHTLATRYSVCPFSSWRAPCCRGESCVETRPSNSNAADSGTSGPSSSHSAGLSSRPTARTPRALPGITSRLARWRPSLPQSRWSSSQRAASWSP